MASLSPTSRYMSELSRLNTERFGAASSGSGAGAGLTAGTATFSPLHSRKAPQDPQNWSLSRFLNPQLLQTIMLGPPSVYR